MKDLISFWFESRGLEGGPAPERINIYARLLLREKKFRNITGASGEAELLREHILPALELALKIKGDFGVDVGSGNGFPGIPAAIFKKEKKIILMEPSVSRASFLEKVIYETGINNAEVIRVRGEDAGHDPALREKFRFATARGVAPFRASCELVLPLLEKGGRFYAQPGSRAVLDIRDSSDFIGELGGSIEDVFENHAEIIKVSPTPERFPRSWKRIRRELRLEKA